MKTTSWSIHGYRYGYWIKHMTCKEVLLQYLKENPRKWHKKVHLYAIAEDWSAETVGRDLRNLAEDKIINVDYYDGKYAKGLAMYSYEKVPELKTKVEIIDGKAFLKEYYE
jgi:hypothetical protein